LKEINGPKEGHSSRRKNRLEFKSDPGWGKVTVGVRTGTPVFDDTPALLFPGRD
jgi:hypothetical protein